MDLHNRQQRNRHEAWRGTHNRWNFHPFVRHTNSTMDVTRKQTHRVCSLLLLSCSQTYAHTHSEEAWWPSSDLDVLGHAALWIPTGHTVSKCHTPDGGLKTGWRSRRPDENRRRRQSAWGTLKSKGGLFCLPQERKARGRGPLIILESVAADSRHCGRQTRHSQQPTEAWGGRPTWVKTLCTIERQVAMVFWVFSSASVVLKRITANV